MSPFFKIINFYFYFRATFQYKIELLTNLAVRFLSYRSFCSTWIYTLKCIQLPTKILKFETQKFNIKEKKSDKGRGWSEDWNLKNWLKLNIQRHISFQIKKEASQNRVKRYSAKADSNGWLRKFSIIFSICNFDLKL